MNLLGLLRDGGDTLGQVQQTVSLNGERATTALPEEVLMSDLLSTHKIIEEFNSDHIIASITMEKSFMHIRLMDSSTGKYAEDKVTYEDYKYSAHPTTIPCKGSQLKYITKGRPSHESTVNIHQP